MSVAEVLPLRVREILDGGIRVYLREARTLLGLVAVVVIPLQVLAFIVDIVVVNTRQGVPGDLLQIGTAANSHLSQGAAIPASVISLFIGALALAVCVRPASESHMGRKVDAGESLRFMLGRLGPIIWLTVLSAVLTAIASVALLVPGIYLYAAWSLSVPVLLIEGLGGRKALSRSRALVKGRWWRVAGVLLASSVIAIIVADGYSLLVLVVIGRGPTVLTAAVTINVTAAIGAIVLNPFQAAVRTVLYHDLQNRPVPASPAAPETSVTAKVQPAPRRPVFVATPMEATEPTRLGTAVNYALVVGGAIAILASIVAVHVFGI